MDYGLGQADEVATLLKQFQERYPVDERAQEYLEAQSDEVKLKVVQTFEPRQQADQDYSRKLTGYIRSLNSQQGPGQGGLKRGGVKEEDVSLLGTEAPSEEELLAFRQKFPMDDRAWEFLTNSSGYVQARIVTEFRPRNENDTDYSAPVTSFVKRTRGTEETALMGAAAYSGETSKRSRRGPHPDQLEEFKQRFPMDDRAWEFLQNAAPDVQERMLSDFKPKNELDVDFSAAVTAFVRSLSSSRGTVRQAPARDGFQQRDNRAPVPARVRSLPYAPSGPTRAELETFRRKFPMDERAYDFLTSLPAEVQMTGIREFSPKFMNDSDYSRPITSFLRQIQQRIGDGGGGGGKGGGAKAYGGPPSEPRERQYQPPSRHHDSPRDSHRSRGGDDPKRWLQIFRTAYPMDERAYDFLESSSPDVQELVISDFKPRRFGEKDYSGAVTSFLKAVNGRVAKGGGGKGGRADMQQAMLQAFKSRYPMDERAWDYLSSSPDSVKRNFLERFKVRQEGEDDYSRLVTAFIKAANGRR